MDLYADIKVIVAAYGVPGIMAIESLFSLGLLPTQVSLLTYNPDKRNLPLINFACANDIETVYFPVQSDEAFDWVNEQRPDVLFSLHYRHQIPARILDIPTFGCVNLHPSLLPNYRGCFSIPWAILEGEQYTGYTYHYMVEKFDEGNIILQKCIPIQNNDTAFSLFHKLIVNGMATFDIVFERVIKHRDLGKLQPKGGRYCPRKLPYNGEININWDEIKIDRFIRAMVFPPHKNAIVRLSNIEYEVSSIDQYVQLIKQYQGKHK